MAVLAIATVGYQRDDADPTNVVWFAPGEEIKNVPDEVVDVWKTNGTVGDPPATLPSVVAEKERLEAQVAELERQLAEAKAAKAESTKVDASKLTVGKA